RDFHVTGVQTCALPISCVALHYGIGLGLALLLNQKLRGRTLYRLLLILPWAVPTFVTVFGWRFMLADAGIINSGLDFLGLPTPRSEERRVGEEVSARSS